VFPKLDKAKSPEVICSIDGHPYCRRYMRMNCDPTVHGHVSNEGLFYDSLEITILMVERVFI
jgi:hypothetical protein